MRVWLMLGSVACACLGGARALAEVREGDLKAHELLTARKLTGTIVSVDTKTGATLADFSSDSTADYLPLSTVKVLLAASYLEHRVDLPAIHFDPHQLIAVGSDSAGRELALDLRKSLGSERVLRDLERFGFSRCGAQQSSDCTTLSKETADADWANALSIGESGFRVTLLGLANFFAAIGNEGVRPDHAGARIMSAETARELQSALLDTVRTGSAAGIRDRMGFMGMVGGKTGSGVGGVQPYDGIFASIAFDPAGNAKMAIVAYVRRGGAGGGVAAEISADLAKFLLARSSPASPNPLS